MKINVRACKYSDVPKIINLLKEWKSELEGGPARDENWFTPRFLQKIIKNNPRTCWILEIDGKMEGFTFVDDDSDGRAWGWEVFISKKYRRKKLGTFLFKESKKRLKKLGFRKLYVECNQKYKPVIKWYKKVGLKRVGIFPDWYGPGAHAVVFCTDL